MLGGKFGADIPFLVSCTIPADFMGIEFATRGMPVTVLYQHLVRHMEHYGDVLLAFLP